ncbi:hypothetical protein [Comamonas jiangduensis]|uniref:hypothetical protein n=1 Tax=Comamonas jiangduensis TaxID=1194168 RepID=UPI003BF911AF
MTTHDANSMAAAELADTYIQLVLSNKPELLVGVIFRNKMGDPERAAKEFAEFRLKLIDQLSQQPLPEVGDV